MKIKQKDWTQVRTIAQKFIGGWAMEIEGSTRIGAPAGDPNAEEWIITTNDLMLDNENQDLHDMIPWKELKKIDFETTDDGLVMIDCYVSSGHVIERELRDNILPVFDADGLVEAYLTGPSFKPIWQRDPTAVPILTQRRGNNA
jgi:hypothetical protein